MQSLTLTFANAACRAAFCTWYMQCLGRWALTTSEGAVQVTFPRRLARTVMTVAQHNHAVVEDDAA